jgi:NADPH:quinone reductase-like Zn-dependent oxidoreductase
LRAYVINELGKPGRVAEIPAPVPGENEVLVRVHAASVNVMDVFVASGAAAAYSDIRLPLVPGIDAAGVVEATGPGVEGPPPGTAVVGLAAKDFWGAGTFAELVSLPVAAIAPKPAELDDATAATLPHAGLTALAALDNVDPRPGQAVLVVGATGGVGSWFTQLAAGRSATVIALVRPENTDYARELGAQATYDYAAANVIAQLRAAYPAGIDALADFSGNGELIDQLADLLRKGGRLTSSAAQLDAGVYADRGLTATQANRAEPARLPELIKLVERQTIRRPSIRTMPLEQAAEALAQVGSHHTRGKVVLTTG